MTKAEEQFISELQSVLATGLSRFAAVQLLDALNALIDERVETILARSENGASSRK